MKLRRPIPINAPPSRELRVPVEREVTSIVGRPQRNRHGRSESVFQWGNGPYILMIFDPKTKERSWFEVPDLRAIQRRWAHCQE